jgi:hypothetical protein
MGQIDKSSVRTLTVALFLFAMTQRIAAQDSPIEIWAQWTVSQGRWKGPTVPYPDLVSRPEYQGWTLASQLYPAVVHAPPELPFSQVEMTLNALEFAYALLIETGWPEPFADGGYGGSAFFDLYLTTRSAVSSAAFVDAPVAWSLLDGASTYALVDASVPPERIEACVVAALVQAVLLGQDPAEAEAWRRATGAYVAWLATGFFGCDDDAATKQQNPWQAWISDSVRNSEGSALLLAILSEREDGGTGTFLRELWQFARQTTKDDRWLRASPDMWEALDRALTNAGESLTEIVEEVAVARYFAGPQHRRRRAPFRSLRTLREDAQVPIVGPISIAQLPKHLPVSEPALETFGSSYTLVDTSQASFPMQLKIWLRGECGGRWSLVAVRLADDGRELGRMAAPARKDQNSYLALELTRETTSVLIVATNLSDGIPDADYDTSNPRVFRLIVDKSQTPVETAPVILQVE